MSRNIQLGVSSAQIGLMVCDVVFGWLDLQGVWYFCHMFSLALNIILFDGVYAIMGATL